MIQIVIYANPVILGGLFANGKDMGGCLPMLNRQRNNKELWTREYIYNSLYDCYNRIVKVTSYGTIAYIQILSTYFLISSFTCKDR